MENKRYEMGLKKLQEVDGAEGVSVIESLNDIAPDMGKYIVEFAFGDIYNRNGINLAMRQAVTIAALSALGGCEKQLQIHINAALNVGLGQEEIIETIIHCVPYIGFPKALNALSVAKEVFKEKKIGGE
ncbi:carboxymuconolactone decarboxylase family protein [uncultured Phocaeicola sp.]|jgi:4-carboxymuconolactone decarboxylase|uniref:carboxymuconolactone decarboxylase family protein n=1 Tax=uncultured Phocaeicola sp. TaxID=990718 RepID=UPI0025AEA29B|nr:carboxymuconolactone decarboxylase family protein [uncultured Phocaeicola sp.]